MSAVDDAAEDVAAELIDAEGMFQTHAGQRDAGAHLGQAIGCPGPVMAISRWTSRIPVPTLRLRGERRQRRALRRQTPDRAVIG